MSGISAYGAYVPYTRLPLAMISGRPAKDGGPEKAVTNYDEDSVTMAVAAALDCLTGLDRSQLDGLMFASTTYPFAEKQGAALIAKALDLPRTVRTADFGGSLRAGTSALRSALDAVAAGSSRRVLVVISDNRMGAPRGALESKFGDGAAAFLVSDSDPIATVDASHSVTNELQDLWRPVSESYTHTWEDRFVISEGFTPVIVEAVSGLLESAGRKASDYTKVALYGPDARAHAGAVRALGFSDGQVQDPLFGRLGNTGVAFAPMLLVAALEDAKPGDRILVAGYGDGADVLSIEVSEHIEKLEPRRGVSGHLAKRKPLRSYESYLKSRNLDPKEWEAGEGGGLSATIRYRERDADISFVGATCTKCGQLHFPAPRVCAKCYTKDQFERARISDRRGKLLSYTFDFFFPASEPPTVMVMCDVDGCHIQIQMANTAPDDVKLDLPVEFAFRKIHEAGQKPNYFWKAVPVEE